MKGGAARSVLLGSMLFLNFMMLPVWFVPLLPYVKALPGGGSWGLWFGLLMGFGTFTSPLFGMFADRFLNAEKVLAICDFASAALLAAAFFVSSPAVLFVLLLLTMAFSMPTWSLTATIALTQADPNVYPRLRIFGTLGWVASGVFSLAAFGCFGFAGFDASPWIFAGGALTGVAAGVVSLLLPPTEPAAKGRPLSVIDALGLRSLVLFKDRSFATFAVLLLGAMIPFQWYNVYAAAYLKDAGFQYLTLTMNLGQVGEIGFMLLVPVLMSRLGYKRCLLIALAALVLRNLSFLFSSAGGPSAFNFVAILVHGLIFGILVVGSQMHVNAVAPKELRSQAQGFIILLTAGLGVFASNFLFDAILARPTATGATPWSLAYAVSLSVAAAVFVLVAVLFPGKKPRAV